MCHGEWAVSGLPGYNAKFKKLGVIQLKEETGNVFVPKYNDVPE